eukprot:746567-Heterocapsa_arctica.AAC.1
MQFSFCTERKGISSGSSRGCGCKGWGSPSGLQGPPSPLVTAQSDKVVWSGIMPNVISVCCLLGGSGCVKNTLEEEEGEPPA